MPKCIKCNKESNHSICESCADELLSNMSREDLIAHALVGMDATAGKTGLAERLKKYKGLLEGIDSAGRS